MGFFSDAELGVNKKKGKQVSNDLMHKHGCVVCPLNKQPNRHPKMPATGEKHPDIYIIGEAPGEEEDIQAKQFVGRSGRLLKEYIPREWLNRIRWNNAVNCRPPQNRTPQPVEIECCRSRIVKDIEESKPMAVFGFGSVPLQWALGEGIITNWRGRRVPIQVGSHKCWYFPIAHPSHILRGRDEKANKRDSDDEHMFVLDVKRAFEVCKSGWLEEPDPYTKDRAMEGIESILDCTHENAQYIIKFLEWAATTEAAGIDIETPPVRPYAKEACILTCAVSAENSTLAFPIDHPEAEWAPKDKSLVVNALLKFLRAPNVHKIVHNLAFELEYFGVLYGRDILRAGTWDCTMSQAFVLDQRTGKGGSDDESVVLTCFSLAFLTKLHFGIDIKQITRTKRETLADQPLRDVLPYNGLDAKFHRLLWLTQRWLLLHEGLEEIYQQHLKRIPTCTLTQIKGMPLNNTIAVQLGKEYDNDIESIIKKIQKQKLAQAFFQRTGRHMNPGSPDDVVVICKDILKSNAGLRKDGKYTVNEDTLTKIKDPLMPLILEYRGKTKLRGTYVYEFGNRVVWPDGMLHPLLNTVRARTARLTSSDPNEQNMPKHDKEAKRIRRQIEALLNHILISLDYGQIEFRVFAMASKDKICIKILWEGYDVHMEWAQKIAHAYPARIGGKQNLTNKDVMKEFRQVVKSAWVFALFFGANLSTCSHYLQVDEMYLRALEREFWKTFSGLKDWQGRTNTFYDENGYVEDVFGRRRYGPLGFNQRINTPIQMGAAGIILDGMNRVSELDIWEMQPIIQVHDDLIWHVPEELAEDITLQAAYELTRVDVFDFVNVPLVVEGTFGRNWCDMEKMGDFSSVQMHGHRMAA